MNNRKQRNDFVDQMVILFAIMVPSLAGAAIGGFTGFIVSLALAVPFAIFVLRFMGVGPAASPRPRRRRNSQS